MHEFLGTLVYDSRGGAKVVHFWRMEAGRDPVRKLMRDVKAVEWLPLSDAVVKATTDPKALETLRTQCKNSNERGWLDFSINTVKNKLAKSN